MGPCVSITGTQAFKYLTYLFKERGVDSQLCVAGVWEGHLNNGPLVP